MDQSDSFQAWRRHWLLTGVLLLLALGSTAVAVVRGPRTYQAAGSVTLLASRAVARTTGDNPYLSFSPSLTLTADVVSGELMAPATVTGLARHGFRDPYTVALATYTTTTTGAALDITVTGRNKAGVEQELNAVMNEIGAKLATLQSGIKPYNRIRVVTIAKNQQATLSVSQTARSLVPVAAGGLLLAFGLPWIVDAQVTRRRERRARRGEAEPEPGFDELGEEDLGWPSDEPGPQDTRIYPRLAPAPAARPGSRRLDGGH